MNYQSKTSSSTSTANSNHNLHGTGESIWEEEYARYITPARVRCIRALKGLSEEAIDSLTEMIENISDDDGRLGKI